MKNKISVSLEQFIDREFMLTGVDFGTDELENNFWNEEANVMRMRLNGVVFNVLEDPCDNYRSAMDEIYIGGSLSRHKIFKPVKVKGEWKPDGDDSLHSNHTVYLRDVVTESVVLEFGTDNNDDYYPVYRAMFNPQNMSINQ